MKKTIHKTKNKPSVNKLSGQSAMEYLMSYGWAVLLIVVVLAGLVYMGFFNPPTPERCNVQSGLSCLSFNLKTDGVLSATFNNGLPKKVKVVAAGCTNSGNLNPAEETSAGSDVKLQSFAESGQVAIQTGRTETVSGINCYLAGGSKATGSVGDHFSGFLYIKYVFIDDPESPRVATGELVANYQPAA